MILAHPGDHLRIFLRSGGVAFARILLPIMIIM